jgi:hypothetical protein
VLPALQSVVDPHAEPGAALPVLSQASSILVLPGDARRIRQVESGPASSACASGAPVSAGLPASTDFVCSQGSSASPGVHLPCRGPQSADQVEPASSAGASPTTGDDASGLALDVMPPVSPPHPGPWQPGAAALPADAVVAPVEQAATPKARALIAKSQSRMVTETTR